MNPYVKNYNRMRTGMVLVIVISLVCLIAVNSLLALIISALGSAWVVGAFGTVVGQQAADVQAIRQRQEREK